MVENVPVSYVLAAVVGVSYVIYRAFHEFPHLLHKRKNHGKKSKCKVIAHRGSRTEGLPENSIAAFRDSVDAKAHVVELDVWLSKDNKTVVFHDSTFERMTKGQSKAPVTSLDYKDFPRLYLDPEDHNRSHLYSRDELTKIPLFEEVLRAIPSHVTLIVEFKQNSDLLISEVARLLTEAGPERFQNVYWFSLLGPINGKLRRIEPTIPTITSVPSMLKILGFYYLGVLPFLSIDDGVFGITADEITLERIRNEQALKALPDVFKRMLAVIFVGKPSYFMVAPKLFAHLRKRGIPVWFLGINEEHDVQLAIESGATGVLTDRVNWLTAHLSQKSASTFCEVE